MRCALISHRMRSEFQPCSQHKIIQVHEYSLSQNQTYGSFLRVYPGGNFPQSQLGTKLLTKKCRKCKMTRCKEEQGQGISDRKVGGNGGGIKFSLSPA